MYVESYANFHPASIRTELGASEPPSSGPRRQIIGRVKKCLKETLVCPDSALMLNVLRFRFVREKVTW